MVQRATHRVLSVQTVCGKLLLQMSSTESGADLATENVMLLSENGRNNIRVR